MNDGNVAPLASLEVVPLGPVMGAEVRGVDVAKPLSPDVRIAILAACDRNKVLVFRDQRLSQAEFLEFSGLWGSVGEHILTKLGRDAGKRVQILTNADADGKPKKSHPDPSALLWHTDKSYSRRPSLATLLYALRVPKSGGDTLFADVCAAYDALTDSQKEEIEGLTVIHSFEHAYEMAGMMATDEERVAAPPVMHPLVKLCGNTGRKAIYCGMYARTIVGMPEERSTRLLKELEEHATQSRFQYRHKWRENDVVVWDNRSTLHAATPFDVEHEVRTLYRTFVEDKKSTLL